MFLLNDKSWFRLSGGFHATHLSDPSQSVHCSPPSGSAR